MIMISAREYNQRQSNRNALRVQPAGTINSRFVKQAIMCLWQTWRYYSGYTTLPQARVTARHPASIPHTAQIAGPCKSASQTTKLPGQACVFLLPGHVQFLLLHPQMTMHKLPEHLACRLTWGLEVLFDGTPSDHPRHSAPSLAEALSNSMNLYEVA